MLLVFRVESNRCNAPTGFLRSHSLVGNLSNASLSNITLTDVDFTGATVNGTCFISTTDKGFTAQQLYTTASYQAKNLSGIVLGNKFALSLKWNSPSFIWNNLSGWNFSGQNPWGTLAQKLWHIALQWGRCLSAAEIRPPACMVLPGRQQLQWGRCLSAAEISSVTREETMPSDCFNGAAAFQQRKWVCCILATLPFCNASMGPLPFSSGNHVKIGAHEWVDVLQWGRCLSAAEIGRAPKVRKLREPASMGPLPFSSGNPIRRRKPGSNTLLQWGRCLSAAEIGRRAANRGPQYHRFNGAAAFQQRK